MMRSESTSALGHPSETKLTLGAAACCMVDLPRVPALTFASRCGRLFANVRADGTRAKNDSSAALDLTFAVRTRGSPGANVKSTALVDRQELVPIAHNYKALSELLACYEDLAGMRVIDGRRTVS